MPRPQERIYYLKFFCNVVTETTKTPSKLLKGFLQTLVEKVKTRIYF